MPKALDLLDQQFEKLIVISKAPNKGNKTYWTCKCECGTIKDVQTSHLTRGLVKSCGCLVSIKNRERYYGEKLKEAKIINQTDFDINLNTNITGIYKITNLINNKIYIGQSMHIFRRLNRHKTTAFNETNENYELPLYRAIRKYGIENFNFTVIDICSIDSLDEREIYWIKYYNSTDKEFGYNLSEGGQGARVHIILSQDDILEIIVLLKSTTLSQTEIADKFNVTQQMISDICLGNSWNQSDETYPLRKKNSSFGQNFDNKKWNKVCIDCGINIGSQAIRCEKCSHHSQRIIERPDRNTLKSLIRTTPFTKIGKQYNVSDNSIRKWCDSYKLPRKSTEIKKISDDDWRQI